MHDWTASRSLLRQIDFQQSLQRLNSEARLARMLTVDDIRRAARRRLPKAVYEFVGGGAETESTVRRNRAAWGDVAFSPRQLVDVSSRDVSTTVLGTRMPTPVLMSPAGLARLVHPDGEVAAARGAGRHGAAMALSTGSSCSLESVAKAASGPLWFQIYMWRDHDVVLELVERARTSGYEAICITVDVPIVGQRERDLRNGMTIPPRLTPANLFEGATHPSWAWGFLRSREITFENFTDFQDFKDTSAASVGTFVTKQMVDPSVTWDSVSWLREIWQGPLLVKGVLCAEDARRAEDLGANGIVVSNHGGRQLDGAPATADVLAEIVDAVGECVEVLVDGGIRRGTDVVKALAMGARAVMVGRPWLWGLAAGGHAGVERVLQIFHEEIDRTLALIGCPQVEDLDRSWLRVPA